MCTCHGPRGATRFSPGASRRRFLATCGAAAAVGALEPFVSRGRAAEEKKARVGLVFLANSAEREIWPYPGFDCATRQKEILAVLEGGCPDIAFIPVVIADPQDVEKAIALKGSVDGYLVYAVTLNWGLMGTLSTVGALGKPMLVADEYLGGSGVFLVGYGGLCRAGIPAAAVAATRPADLVAVAHLFADVKMPGVTPASFARRCEEVYRRTFASPGATACISDRVALTGIGESVKRLGRSRFLIVGAGQAGTQQQFLGATGIHVGFEEFGSFCEKVDRDEAASWGRRWSAQADKVVEAVPEWIAKAGGVYLAMTALMRKYGTDSITMNCLGGFGSGQLPAYPCLGFMQILNDGGQGVCEAMPDDSVSTLMARILTGRAAYVSDPVLDTSKNQIVYSHCMALTKVFGPEGPANKFRIRTLHNRDPRGCCAQSFLPEGYMTTTFRTNCDRKSMVMHQAKAIGNLDLDRGCRTQLVGDVRGDIGRMFREWDRFGWHRVTVYGDVREPLLEFAKALGLAIILEA